MFETSNYSDNKLACENTLCVLCVRKKCTASENMDLLCNPPQYVEECPVKKAGEELIQNIKSTLF